MSSVYRWGLYNSEFSCSYVPSDVVFYIASIILKMLKKVFHIFLQD